MKKTIKIKYVDFWPLPTGVPQYTMFHNVLKKHYNIEYSENPDYVICSCFGKDYEKYDCIRIMLIGENYSTDWNEYDYGIDFDDYTFLDRHFHMHNNALMNLNYPSVNRMLTKHLWAPQSISSKTEFCSYVYTNPVPFRQAFFDRLSQYKPVNPGGKCKGQKQNKQWNKISIQKGALEKIAFESQHKFSIAFENSVRDGYVTEKLVDAFAAGTVPIYYGASDVTKYFNEKAMIIVKDENDVENAIARIQEIDQNDELYLRMLKEKAVLDESVFEEYPKEFENFVCHIFDQPLELAKRRTSYKRKIIKRPKLRKRIKNKIRRMMKGPQR